MLEALRTISLLADGEDPDNLDFGIGRATPGELATRFSQFEVCSGCCLATKSLNNTSRMTIVQVIMDVAVGC